MVAPCQRFTHQRILAPKLLTAYVHRSTLPQSRIRSTAPSEREPGMGACHSSSRPETGRLRAIFIAPTKLRDGDIVPFTEVHSLSLASLDSSLREGAGNGLCHSSYRSEARRLRAIFIAPTKTQRWGHCTIHRGARQSAALHSSFSTKEMGGGMAAAHWGVIALLRICTLRPRRFSGSTWG